MTNGRDDRPLVALFAFQHRFFQTDDGRVWSPGMFPSSLWGRYLKHFDRLLVLGRLQGRGGRPPAGWVVSSHPLVEFRFLPDVSGVGRLVKSAVPYFRKLIHAIRSSDAVISRTSLVGCIAALVARRMGRPCAFEVVGCAWDAAWNHGRMFVKFVAPAYFLLTRLAVRESRYSLYVTERFLQSRYPSAHDALQVAVSDVELDVQNVSTREGGEWQPDRPFVFGLIGSLVSRYKGIQTVLAALPAVLREHDKVLFRVLGSGPPEPWREEARRLGVEKVVHFDGVRAPGAEVLDWLKGLDAYLQPSFQEGLPRALVEAMSVGLPAIGSKCGGIPELLEEECLIKPGDSAALAALMCHCIANADWRRRQGTRNQSVASRYDRQVLEARRDAFYGEFSRDVRLAKCRGVK